ncbi:MAG TPA: UbiA family prenyltransferase [Acidimicrobiia bacterium]
MKRSFEVMCALVRPPFAVLLGLCMAVGMAQTGHLPSLARQCVALVAVGGWMLWAVALNDVADEHIDRVNLANDAQRVLVTGRATRKQVVMIALGAGAVAIGAAVVLGAASVVVVACGLALAAAYSLPPLRLCGRGALTSALLPLGYVAVPFLLGAFSSGSGLNGRGLVLLAGLYLGFMGRLVLKDFRDERGDRLYEKRTMLVRHGRAPACAFSAVFWTAGAIVVVIAQARPVALVVATVAYVVAVLVMLRDLACDRDGMRDGANISAIAVVGRALVYTFLIQMVTAIGGWGVLAQNLIIAAVGIAALGMARELRLELLPTSDSLTEHERLALPPPGDVFTSPAARRERAVRGDLVAPLEEAM